MQTKRHTNLLMYILTGTHRQTVRHTDVKTDRLTNTCTVHTDRQREWEADIHNDTEIQTGRHKQLAHYYVCEYRTYADNLGSARHLYVVRIYGAICLQIQKYFPRQKGKLRLLAGSARGVCSIFLRVDISINKIFKPRVFFLRSLF